MTNLTEAGAPLVQAFVALADTLVEDFDTVDFLSSLTERVVGLGFASEAGILLADENDDLQFMAASHERTHLLELFQAQKQEGPCQDCYTTGESVSVDDLALELERWPQFAPQALAAGFRSVQAFPLRLRGTILGALNLFLEEPGGIHPRTQAIVQALGDVATIGILQHRELHRSHTVEAQLQHALHSRISIEQAKGIVSEQTHLDMDASFDVLRRHARSSNLKLADVARNVVDGSLHASDLSPA
jgi:hypothetical protein